MQLNITQTDGSYLKLIILSILVLVAETCFALAIPQNVKTGSETNKIPISVEKKSKGAPLTFGLPFSKGALNSPDHVKVLDSSGQEIPSQITKVASWEPADKSIQWVWVFVFATGDGKYTVEYGPDVYSKLQENDKIRVSNHWVEGGSVKINTGKLKFSIRKGTGGFLNNVKLDLNGDGFKNDDLIARSPGGGRGTFVDILDDKGLNPSKAEVTYAKEEKGSGPMHSIVFLKGMYHYSDKNDAPFEMRIHVYAGKSYVRVLNTMIYTGQPTQHPPLEGQHALIATTADTAIINEDSLAAAKDKRWTEPKDQIAKMGLNLKHNLEGPLRFMTSYKKGKWWEDGPTAYYDTELSGSEDVSILQTGKNPTRMPPLPTASTSKRIDGFKASIIKDGKEKVNAERMPGWVDISNEHRGISIGTKNFFKEFPKEISMRTADSLLQSFSWPADIKPMSFARYSDSKKDGGMFDNFAQGLGKTTESVYYFHDSDKSRTEIENKVNYFLDAPVAHAKPQWYTDSKVFGDMVPSQNKYDNFERGMKYKYQWTLFNQSWEPWYGMWDYGETKNYFIDGNWYNWSGNEPAQDFMWWRQFIRTGNRKYYQQAKAMSRETMDVKQIHWPKESHYSGNENPALAYWKSKKQPKGSPYVGMGRRHSPQHWIASLSAHVWVPGWITDYFITGNHRGLEVAKETGDLYLRRIWGEHGTTGRRLYLSVWNLDWIYNATKLPKYKKELDYRANKMMRLQKSQEGNLVIHRYDYSQVYASHGLEQYLNFTGEQPGKVKNSLIENARRLRDVPPWGHAYESYLSTIHPLLLGYKYSGNQSFLTEALDRAEVLKMDSLPKEISSYKNQKSLVKALDKASNMPQKAGKYEQRGVMPIWRFASGMRVFGWTHAYHVPELLYWFEENEDSSP